MITPLESEALLLCITAHAGQLDKAGKPYAAHPIRVGLSCFDGCTQDMFIAALLHDVVEDTHVTLEEIEEKFGACVADAVNALTRRKSESYHQYILRCKANPIARRVKLSDIEDNTRPERIAALPKLERPNLGRYARAKAILEAA